MNSIHLSQLVPNTYFDKPVYLDASFILLTPDSPVTPDLVKRLQKWKYQQVFSDGKTKDLPSYQSGTQGGTTQTIDEDIRENAQAAAAQKFYAEFTAFSSGMFAKFVSDGELNMSQVTDWVKKAMQVVHDSRDFLMRFLDVSADGDRYLVTHSVNSTILALAVADYLKAPPHRLIEMGAATLLHEIGMFKLPVELRRTSKSLGPDERKAMMAHTVLGYRILKGLSAPENVALAALEHHERIDGSGYPRALSAPKITDHALIIGVVCSYDAMISRRPFRPGTLDGHAIIKDLAQKNRKQYDERILKALVYALSVYPVGTAVELSNRSRGIVIKTDSTKPRCPMVRVLVDADGKRLVAPPIVQVSDSDGVSITGVLGAEEARSLKEPGVNVRVVFPDGHARDFPAGTPLFDVASDASFPRTALPTIAVIMNNEVVSLQQKLTVNCSVTPVALGSRPGAVIYRRSLCFLLAMAATRAFPRRRLIVGHSLGQSYYYHFDGLEKVTEEDLDKLRTAMEELAGRNLPVRSLSLSYAEAVDYFQKHNQPDTLLLLENRNDPSIQLHSCDGFLDLAHGPLVPTTGVLSTCGLVDYPPGFLLRYPPAEEPLRLATFVENPVLFSIYREYKSWGKILRVGSIGRLDELIREGGIQEFIQVAEALQDKKIAEIADRINEMRDQVKVVLIAGPSSSGKTTFSKKLMVQLRVVGRNPVTISLDDYFRPQVDTPRDEEGKPDFESLGALDVELLNDNLVRLLKGEEVATPLFDFHTGTRKTSGRPTKLPDRAILILEGIHGLNDALTPLVERSRKHKIYVSALTQLNLDDHNRIATTDNRLVRRMVRDSQFRGHTALRTLSMWPSVRRGEDRNIFPFQNSADSAFNSALDYELAVLKVYAEPLLASVKPDVPEYQDARALLSFLANFAPLHPRWVPATSILREFIGESAFKY